MRIFNKIAIGALTVSMGIAGVAFAATKIDLGTAGGFAVLAGSTITNTGSTVINGNIGLSPGTSATGFPPGTVNGVQHLADANALAAQADLITAYNNAAGQTPVTTVPTELGGTTKTAGVYDSASGTFGITGALTLDAKDDPNAVFIFKSASTLITAGASSIVLTNGAQACNVYWQVGSSATLGTNSTFKGYILALTSITLTGGASVEGGVFTRNGAVTLDTNSISRATCAAVLPPAVVATSSVAISATTTTQTTATTTGAVVPAISVTPLTNPIVPVSAVIVPQAPNTGAGGNAAQTLFILFLSTLGAVAGAQYLKRQQV